MMRTILIIEDDRKIAALVAKNLEAAGFQCVQTHDGESALLEVARQNPALIVLDILLPRIDGLEVLRRIRRNNSVPVLMLTARTDEADKVLGFEVGADDYLTKPFSVRELVARVRALLRRMVGAVQEQILLRGELRIDPDRFEVKRGDTMVELTTLEFNLLYFLASRPGRMFTREALMAQVWGEDRVVDQRSIDSLISRLRRKIEPDPARPRYLQTIWGAGYRFSESVE